MAALAGSFAWSVPTMDMVPAAMRSRRAETTPSSPMLRMPVTEMLSSPYEMICEGGQEGEL